METVALFNNLYTEFNARNLDVLIDHLAEDADWPKGTSGERAIGHEAIRDYWTTQWRQINSQVIPISYRSDGDIVVVEVHQLVKDMEDNVLSDSVIYHSYVLANGEIVRMDVTPELPRDAAALKAVPARASTTGVTHS
jgi:hypothetical protein